MYELATARRKAREETTTTRSESRYLWLIGCTLYVSSSRWGRRIERTSKREGTLMPVRAYIARTNPKWKLKPPEEAQPSCTLSRGESNPGISSLTSSKSSFRHLLEYSVHSANRKRGRKSSTTKRIRFHTPLSSSCISRDKVTS